MPSAWLPPFRDRPSYGDAAMGLKVLTSVKLFLYDCQNNFWTLPDPSSPGFRAIHEPGGQARGCRQTRRKLRRAKKLMSLDLHRLRAIRPRDRRRFTARRERIWRR